MIGIRKKIGIRIIIKSKIPLHLSIFFKTLKNSIRLKKMHISLEKLSPI